jgi:hypothetical protein
MQANSIIMIVPEQERETEKKKNRNEGGNVTSNGGKRRELYRVEDPFWFRPNVYELA